MKTFIILFVLGLLFSCATITETKEEEHKIYPPEAPSSFR